MADHRVQELTEAGVGNWIGISLLKLLRWWLFMHLPQGFYGKSLDSNAWSVIQQLRNLKQIFILAYFILNPEVKITHGYVKNKMSNKYVAEY